MLHLIGQSGHSGNGDLVCGGSEGTYVISTCYNVITAETINLNEPRSYHTSWSTDSGVYLLGGQISNGNLLKSVEFINTSTSSVHSRVSGFQLRKSTSYACGISDYDDGSFIITGGRSEDDDYTTLVSKYSEQGWTEDLPRLKQGRRRHACGTYVDSNGSKIYLVTGGDSNEGHLDPNEGNLASTELLEKNGDGWILYENSLPRESFGLKGVSFNNEVFVSGGADIVFYEDSIFQFQKESKTFVIIGRMQQTRLQHALTIVKTDDYICYEL